MTRMRNFSSKLQIMSSFIISGTICAKGKHSPCKTGQMAHLSFKVPILPLPDEGQSSTGLSDEMFLYGLQED